MPMGASGWWRTIGLHALLDWLGDFNHSDSNLLCQSSHQRNEYRFAATEFFRPA